MRVDGKDPFVWDQLNQIIKAQLGCSSKVMVFRGMHQALFETCLALHLKFGHKRRIVAQMGFGDHLRETELELAKLGVRFKDQFEEDMVKEEKANLAYIHDLDDSLTGELYNHIDTLKKVSETKIYRIHVAHHLFHFKKTFIQKLSEYDMIVCALDKYYCLVFCGEKVSLPQMSVKHIPWDLQKDGAAILKLLKKENKDKQNEVIKFESSLPDGVSPWFTKVPSSRIYDRAMVILKDMDAFAFMELYSKDTGEVLLPPGETGLFETSSYNRWQNDIWFKQAPSFGRTPADMRGALSVDASRIDDQFINQFKKTLSDLKKMSS